MTANTRGTREGRTTVLRRRTSKGVLATLTGGLMVASAWGVGTLTVHGAAADGTPGTGPCTTTISGTHTTPITASTGTTCLSGATQTGAITVNSPGALSVVNSTVTGAITSTSTAPFTFCSSKTVRGAISVSGSKGFVLIGGAPGAATCGANNIDGAITANNNTGGVEVGGNTTSGAISLTNNVAPTSGSPSEVMATAVEGNHDGGKLTCSGNVPAPTNNGSANTVNGSRVGQTCASGTF
jgi:hexosaminidase